MRILIAEDELKTLRGLSSLIGKMGGGYEVVGEVRDGEGAIACLEQRHADIVLTDIRMLRMDGITLIRKLQETGFEGEFIILSGHSDFEYTREALHLKISDYLLKPITPELLKNALDRAYQALQDKKGKKNAPKGLEDVFQQFVQDGMDPALPSWQALLDRLLPFSGGVMAAVLVCAGQNHDRASFWGEALQRAFGHRGVQGAGAFCREPDRLCLVLAGNGQVEWRELLARYQAYLVANGFGQAYLFYEPVSVPQGLPAALQRLGEMTKWRILLSPGSIVSASYLAGILIHQFLYPAMLDEQVTACIRGSRYTEALALIDDFSAYLARKTYLPQKIIDAWGKLVSSMLSAIKLVHYPLYLEINQMEVFARLGACSSLEQMRGHARDMVERLATAAPDQEELAHCSKYTLHAIRAVQSGYNTDLSLAGVAQQAGVSAEHLGRLFRAETGTSFVAYLTGYRMEIAKKLLLSRSYKVGEVAVLVGIPDAKYFCNVFKKYTGQKPSTYR